MPTYLAMGSAAFGLPPALGNWLDEHWEETLPQVELKLEIHNRIGAKQGPAFTAGPSLGLTYFLTRPSSS